MDRLGTEEDEAGFIPALRGLRVLIVEDEPLVAMALEETLRGLGCTVEGVAFTVAQALALVEAIVGIEAAILDIRLREETVFPVADALADRGVGFAFSTGGGLEGLDERYPGCEILDKPYPTAALIRALASIAARRSD